MNKWVGLLLNKVYLKSGKANYKLTQLIAGTFPRHFLKNSKQKSKQSLYWRTTRKRTNQNKRNSCLDNGHQKMKFKIVWEKFQHRAGSICS